MKATGEFRVAASRAEVWAGFGELERLKGCLDGCQSLQAGGEGVFVAKLDAALNDYLPGDGRAQTAPVQAEIRFTELDPPQRFRLNLTSQAIGNQAEDGEDGVGSASAVVELEAVEDDASGEATLLRYYANDGNDANKGQISPASSLIDDFIAKFVAGYGRATTDYEPSQQWLIWAIMFGVLLLAVVLTL